jgi:GTP pyrophosphokinase
MYEVERKIDVEWARSASDTFPVRVLVHTEDRPGILNHLTTVLFNEQSNIRSLEARGTDGRDTDGAIIEMTVEVRDKKQLERVISSIRRISGVRDIERVNQ